MSRPDGAHARPADEIIRSLGVDPARGLDSPDVRERLRRHGPNRLRQARTRSAWGILLDQFRSLIVALLAAALLLAFVTRDWLEAIAIGVVIGINAAIGFVSELRAIRSMEALRQLGRATAVVRREGELRHLPAEALVPGDIVIIEGGDVITADVRLLEASKLQVDESVLTGESAPVDKQVQTRPVDTPLAERSNMLFKGTAVTRGSGLGVVAATGMGTELGRISALTEAGLDRDKTPLEKRLDQLGRSLVWLTLVLTALVAGAGLLSGRPPLLIAKTSIALAVAAVPEGLPIVATLALARGMWRMAKRRALIRRLAAVETLGATTVICADKTGTLTENRMTVVRLATSGGDVEIKPHTPPPADDVVRALLEVAVLCNNASLSTTRPGHSGRVGDPMEIALLELGALGGVERGELEKRMPERREVAFDPEVKMMATYHPADDGVLVCVKGAPGAVLEAATAVRTADGICPLGPAEREAWLDRNERLAADGLRVLALASARVASVEVEPYANLTLLGLVGIVDPPRADVPDAVARCRAAGVRVVMLTGDQAATARNIGRRVGLVDRDDAPVVHGRDLGDVTALPADERERVRGATIFARVSPRQKLDLIRLYRERDVVAMTGDGVNDAPALKSADIGIAMGRRGTDVAREAADMVLRDDAFPTIVEAIAQGRVIFDNIRAFIRYLISCNISEILVVFIAAAASLPLPMLPLQILFLNLVTDVFPALALGFGEGDEHVMDRPPRDPADPIVTRRHWAGIVAHGLLLAAAVLAALLVALHWLGLDEAQSVTVSFLTLAFAQLWHVFNIRRARSGVLFNEVTRNPFVWGALGLCTGLIFAAVYVPPMAAALDTVEPGPAGWALVAAASTLPLFVGQITLALRRGQTA